MQQWTDYAIYLDADLLDVFTELEDAEECFYNDLALKPGQEAILSARKWQSDGDADDQIDELDLDDRYEN